MSFTNGQGLLLTFVGSLGLSFVSGQYTSYNSCAEIASDNFSPFSDGEYTLAIGTVYCKFDYDNEYAWTMIESGSYLNFGHDFEGDTIGYGLLDHGFTEDLPYHEDEPSLWMYQVYRMSLSNMLTLQASSKYVFATCNFDTSMTDDYWLMQVSSMEKDPLSETFTEQCFTTDEVDIRGYECIDGTAPGWSSANNHFHIDSASSACSCTGWTSDATTGGGNEDNFGHYNQINTAFSCTASETSTTQWWFGDDVQNPQFLMWIDDDYIGVRSTVYMTWNEANGVCDTFFGSDLASITSADADAAAFAAVLVVYDTVDHGAGGGSDEAHFGFTDVTTEGTFEWIDGNTDTSYTNWAPNEPNDSGGVQDCSQMYLEGTSASLWDDHGCDDRKEYYAICNREPSSSVRRLLNKKTNKFERNYQLKFLN